MTELTLFNSNLDNLMRIINYSESETESERIKRVPFQFF